MRRIAAICAALLISCAPADQPADEPVMEEMAAGLSLADVAGTWTVRVLNEAGDSTLTTYELNATAETTGWTTTLQGREPMAFSVTVDADSIMSALGPFESVLRPGVMVTSESVFRLRDGMLTGTLTAHYTTTAADSVLHGRLEGTRVR